MGKGKTILRRTGKVLLYVLLVFTGVLLSLWIFINSDYGKNVIRKQAVQYLQHTLKTKVRIGKLDYSIPNSIELGGVYIEDQKHDTLLYAGKLSLSISMLDLLKNNINIQNISAADIYANLYSEKNNPDFNYQFIIDAFAGDENKKETATVSDTSSMQLHIGKIALKNIRFIYNDRYGGTNLQTSLAEGDISINKIDLDRSSFDISQLTTNGVKVVMHLSDGKSVAAADSDGNAQLPLIALHQIELNNTDIVFEDSLNQIFFSNKTRQLNIDGLFADLNKQNIENGTINIDSTNLVFHHISQETVSDTAVSAPWTFSSDKINISRSEITYNDNASPAIDGFDASHIFAENINSNINNIYFGEDTLSFEVGHLAFQEKSGLVLDTAHANFSMSKNAIKADNLYVKTPNSLLQRSFHYSYKEIDDFINKPNDSRMELSIHKSYISSKDLAILSPDLKKILPSEFFKTNRIDFSLEADGNMNKLNVSDFSFSGLNGSSIDAKGKFYNLLDSNKIAYDIKIIKSNFLKKDLALFVPKEHASSLADLPDNFQLSGNIKGDMKNADADILANANGFEYNGLISVKNFDKPENLKFDVNTRSFSLNTKMILAYLPADIKDQLFIPSNISAKGLLRGNSNNILTDLNINSSLGALKLKGFINNMDKPEMATYDLVMSTPGFMLGKLLKQDSTLGRLNGTFSAKGKGFDYKTMSADFFVKLHEFEYNNYLYRNIDLQASAREGVINSKGSIDDENIRMSYHIDGDISKEFPVVASIIKLDTVQLNKLHLIEDTLNLSGSIVVDAANLKPHQLDASLLLKDFHITTVSKHFPVYDAGITAKTAADGNDSLHISTTFATIDAGGYFEYDSLTELLMTQLNKYYHFSDNPTRYVKTPQHVGIKGKIIQDEILSSLIPDNILFKQIDLSGDISSNEHGADMNLNISTGQLRFEDKEIRNIRFSMNGEPDVLLANIQFDTLNIGENTFHQTSLNTSLQDNKLDFDFLVKDQKSVNWLGVSGNMMAGDGNYSIHLTNDVLLNYEYWSTVDDNEINISPEGFYVRNFMLSNDTSLIYVNSSSKNHDSNLAIDIDNFSLKSIGLLFSDDSNFVSGIIDAKLSAGDFDKAIPSFDGQATIDELTFMGYPIGNISCYAEKKDEDRIKADFRLDENGNDIHLEANYQVEDTSSSYQAILHVNKLNLNIIEAFSEGQLQNCRGNIHGDIFVDGSDDFPIWKGALQFDSTSFKISMLGTTYRINNQQVSFNSPEIRFDDIAISDSMNHVLKVNGKMNLMPDYNLGMGIVIKADDFVLMNAKKILNSEFYGYAAADLKVTINGTIDKPVIEGDIVVDDKTDVTLVMPDGGYVKDDGNTVVRFVDRDTFMFADHASGFIQNRQEEHDFTTFLKYNLNLSVSKNASFRIIIDPSTGDEIKVQGDAHINAGVDPGGNIVLTGNYELSKGYYILNYQFLKRQFNLVKGSNINFAGSVDDAIIDISAAYVSNAASYDLLSSELTDISNSDAYKKKIPFNVILHITGKLFKPEINFDVQLPEQGLKISNDIKNQIESKLNRLRQDQATMNKQVFSLLLMNKFISEQSSDFLKYTNIDFSGLARKSVSGFLSSAINEIAGDIFKGIDVDLNLNSYNDYMKGNSEQRTDLNIAISKSFFNNRLTISVGNNFGLSGQQGGSNANTFRPDANMSYKLSRDGKYMISAYTKNQFEIVLDGYVVESGVSFSVTLDYDTFREFFGNKNKD